MKKLTFFLFITAGLAFTACEPTPDELELFDQFVVSTNYDTDVDFASYATYTIMTDTIGLVSNLVYDDTIIVGNSYARPVVEAVKSNLNTRGYVRVDKTEDPDVAINVFVVKNLDVFQQVNYAPYYGYSGYYSPSYYGYYNNYYVSTYVQNTGTLVVEIVDLKNAAQNKAKVVWNTHIGDVFGSLDLQQQSVDAVNQAFTQSSYIDRTL